MVTLGGTASAEPHLNDPRLMWAVTSQGCCSLAAPSCFCPVFRCEIKLKALFTKTTEAAAELSIWAWCERRKRSLAEVPKRENRHYVSWGPICTFPFHIALSLKLQCVLNPYVHFRRWGSLQPHPPTWKVVFKLMVPFKTFLMAPLNFKKSCQI